MEGKRVARGKAWLRFVLVLSAVGALFWLGLATEARFSGAKPENAKILRGAAERLSGVPSRQSVDDIFRNLAGSGIEYKWIDDRSFSAWIRVGIAETCWLTGRFENGRVGDISIRDDEGKPCSGDSK